MSKKQKNINEINETIKDTNTDLTSIISTAIKLPGVKVNRKEFLMHQFPDIKFEDMKKIIELGPINAGCSRELLKKKANKLIKERTAVSTSASFVAGIPGGFAMAATIPADMLQFYGVALRLAQELIYLYGEEDIWCDGAVDQDKVTNQLILYCGVMLGATGAAQTVRLMSSALAKQALKKIPKIALTKTFYYPIVKSILKFFGVSVTKQTFAKGVSKVIPFVGGFISGGLTLASMLPMGNRLLNTLDVAHFDYDEEDIKKDIDDFIKVQEEIQLEEDQFNEVQEEKIEVLDNNIPENNECETNDDNNQKILAKLKQTKQMYEEELITEEEYRIIKTRLLEQMDI